MLYGGIEAGGSKWECAIGSGADDLRITATVPTTTPDETIDRVVTFFERQEPITALGIGSFGPVDRDPSSSTWGYITTTPKSGWADTDIAQEIGRRLAVPVVFDTDVNAAALGEYRWGAGRGLGTFSYITVGTGIGGGAVVNGELVHGLVHPEFGHMRIPHDQGVDPFEGVCPYHGDCWEGLASGRAIEARWGRPAVELGDDDAVWELQADYLALGLVAVICVLSPERIILGGGVMEHDGLLQLVRQKVRGFLNGYVVRLEQVEDHIVRPQLGARAGVVGAIALARTRASGFEPS